MLFSFIVFSCNNNSSSNSANADTALAKSTVEWSDPKGDSIFLRTISDVHTENLTDTINVIDAKGFCQGYWIINGYMLRDKAYAPDAIVKEGRFLNNKKEGVWYEYKSNGAFYCVMNYSGGKVIDTLKHKNGNENANRLNVIDPNGLREGWWMITGLMQNDPAYANDSKFSEGLYVLGKEEGEWIFYNRDGSVKKKINYKAGVEVK